MSADERVVRVLAEHSAAGYFATLDGHAECYCGHVLDASETYPAHVAAALAPVLAEVRAEALREAAGAMRVAAVDRSASHWRAHAWGNWLRDRADRIEGQP